MDVLLELLDQATRTLGNAVLSILPFVFLYEGARRWSFSHEWRNARAWLAGGLALLAIGVGMNAVAAHFTQKILIATAPRPIPTVDDSWGHAFSPEKREEISRLLGMAALRESHEVRNYVDITGAWKPYCATEEDLKDIVNVAASKAKLAEVSSLNRSTVIKLLLWGLVAVVAGWLVGIELRRATRTSAP